MTYDSTQDTQEHIGRVQNCLMQFGFALLERAAKHDASKLQEPEKSTFDRVTPRLKELAYGSDEYKAALADMGEALKHHYAANDHHPESTPDGIAGMTLLSITEMMCDWKAAGERHADGDFAKSIEINIERFDISPQLAAVLRNTAAELGWIEESEQ